MVKHVAFLLGSVVLLVTSATDAATYGMCVPDEGLTLYAATSARSTQSGPLNRGARITVTEEKGRWAHINYVKGKKTQEAWTLLGALVPCEQETANATHFHPFGRPIGEVKAGVLLENAGYDCMYDPGLRFCRWVGYCYRPTGLNVPRYRGQFVADERIPEGQRAEPDDYFGLYKKDLTGFDRGHMAPDASLKAFGMTAQEETYRLSNITPQYSLTNQGFWRELEANIRSWSTTSSPICVETGPVFFPQKRIERRGRNQVAIPHAYYAIVAQGSPPNTIAFLVPNEPFRHGWSEAKNFLIAIDEIERLTGLDFFPNLSPDVQSAIESSPAAELWEP